MTDGKRPVGQVDPRLRGRRTHLCSACDFPIAVYGRCRAAVTKLERIPAGTGLYISPLTLQAYRNEADLARHAQQLQGTLQTLMASGPTAGGTQQQQQQHMGWKPPPPPGAPPGSSAGGGYGRQPQQHQFGRQRQGPGNVMVPR